MRSLSLAIALTVAVAMVLTFSVRSYNEERTRLRQNFVVARQADVRELASDLESRLRDLEEDGRVIEALIGRTYDSSGTDRDDRTRAVHASFDALATVIRHYKTLVLLSSGNSVPVVVATDVSEAPSISRDLVRMSSAPGPGMPHLRGLTGPVELEAGRVFYFYRFPAGVNEVVLSIDGPLLVQSAVRSVPDSRVIVTDPRGFEWFQPSPTAPFSIRPPAEHASAHSGWGGATGAAWLDRATAQRVEMPVGSTLAAWASATPTGMGAWQVLLLRTAWSMAGRERALLRQVTLTATSLLIAIGILGILIRRQQRYSTALAERLRSAEALRSLERQLISAEKLATTGVLAAGIAHEVGTPLGIIRARAELLLDDIDRSDNRRALEAIVQQIDRISSTIRQVLDFSRVQPVELGQVDLAAAVPLVLDLLGHRLRQQGVVVGVDVAPGLPPLAADANQLQQVLINILLNACDACETGGRIQITARRSADGKRARLEIHDTGQGIPPEHLLAVFDPFFSTKKRGEGTGLGLPIAASIIRNHGGDISLASTPEQGTAVTITWPTAAEGARA